MDSVEKLIHLYSATIFFCEQWTWDGLHLLSIISPYNYFTIFDFIRNACMKAEFDV